MPTIQLMVIEIFGTLLSYNLIIFPIPEKAIMELVKLLYQLLCK